MKKLIFVRYGAYDFDEHLNDYGKQSMISVAEKIKPFVKNENTCIVSAKIPRAIESALIISEYLDIFPVKSFLELYAADEINIFPDPDKAIKIINSEGEKYNIVIAVISREYIETLPNYILESLGSKKEEKEIHLNGGQALILDYETKSLTYLD